MGELDETQVTVPLWTVVMAIRYGMGRHTYANMDASLLARRHWRQFPEFIRDQIRLDAGMLGDTAVRREWEWLTGAGPDHA